LSQLSSCLVASAPSPAVPSAPLGIPRELPVERAAKVSDLHYDLAYMLVPHAAKTAATEHLRFHLKSNASPLLLDFRDGHVDSLSIIGQAAPVNENNGHIILSASALRLGANELEVDFTANIAAAEKAITRFDDRDDGSEYIYTLFVPMDASMAFPCFDQPDLKGRFHLEITAPEAWTVISNTDPVSSAKAGDAQTKTIFGETEPISTYLFAYAAGPLSEGPCRRRTPGPLCAEIEGQGGVERGSCGAADGSRRDAVSGNLLCPAFSLSEVRHDFDSRLCVWWNGTRGGDVSS
jgi:aminopeptidase N